MTKTHSIIITDVPEYLTLAVNGTMLPHGSGIDYDWTYDVNQEVPSVTFKNSYHTMDEYGGYCCITDFTVTMAIVDDTLKVTEIEVTDNDCEYCYTADLDDYLWQTFSLDFNV